MFKSLDQVIKEGIMQIVDYHANTVCLPFHQGPCRMIWTVPQFTDRILNQFPHLGFDIITVIDHS